MVFKYYESKQHLARHYPVPELDVPVEPFTGSTAYAVEHRRCASRVVLLEWDTCVVDLWLRLLAMPADEESALPVPKAGQRSSDLLVAMAGGRTTRDTPGEFIVSQRMADRFEPITRRIASILDECRHFEVVEGDFTSAPDIEATWFVAPRYQRMGSGRRDRARGGGYPHSSRDLNYRALGNWTLSPRGQVITCDAAGATWMPWTDSVRSHDGGHCGYQEVWWQRSTLTSPLSSVIP